MNEPKEGLTMKINYGKPDYGRSEKEVSLKSVTFMRERTGVT